MNKQEKVFRFNVCFECANRYVCRFKDEGNNALRQLIDFQNSPDGGKLNTIQSPSGRPFSVRLVCSEFIPDQTY